MKVNVKRYGRLSNHFCDHNAILDIEADHPVGREGLTAFSEKRKPKYGAG